MRLSNDRRDKEQVFEQFCNMLLLLLLPPLPSLGGTFDRITRCNSLGSSLQAGKHNSSSLVGTCT